MEELKYYGHQHPLLMLNEERLIGNGNGVVDCSRCGEKVSAPCFSCVECCGFYLHKTCAEAPLELNHPFHRHHPLLLLRNPPYTSYGRFWLCLRCFDLLLQDAVKIPGHKHPLLLYIDFEGQCSACGRDIKWEFRCKDCNIHFCHWCVMQPTRVRHKCDEHILALTYDKVNDYAKYHYCDICEKERDPKHWFYHCKTCDTSAHMNCVLGEYPFIKLGSTYNEGNHEHPLTFVKKIHYYPKCIKCDKPCEDLSLECAEPGCNYIAHWECIIPMELW